MSSSKPTLSKAAICAKAVDQQLESVCRWSVRDKVVAFESKDNMWREGIIREMYKHQAYIICGKDETVRAALVEISNLAAAPWISRC